MIENGANDLSLSLARPRLTLTPYLQALVGGRRCEFIARQPLAPLGCPEELLEGRQTQAEKHNPLMR